MAIKKVEVDRRDCQNYRNYLKRGGYISASYLSVSGLDAIRLKKLAIQGRLDAVRCAIGKSVRWYYCEKQAELAHLRRSTPGKRVYGSPYRGFKSLTLRHN